MSRRGKPTADKNGRASVGAHPRQLRPPTASPVPAGSTSCAYCGEVIPRGYHFHSRRDNIYGYQEICCACIKQDGVICALGATDKAIAPEISNAVGYSRSGKKRGGRTTEYDDDEDSQGWEYGSKEEQEVSKTSQKNKEVQKAMKGKAEAKASKNGAKPGRPKTEKIPYEFKPLSPNFKGVAGKATMSGNVLKNVPFHHVEHGKTACGYSTQEVSPGLQTYELNWAPIKDGEVTCARCVRNMNKPEPKPKAEKKAAAPKKAKAKKELATANA